MTYSKKTEETLDPEDWDEMRALGHKILDDMMTYLETVEDQPFTYPTPESIQEITKPIQPIGDGEETTCARTSVYQCIPKVT